MNAATETISISVVIPTLNEGIIIESLLRYLRDLDPGLELIVADGGSTDDTVKIAESHLFIMIPGAIRYHEELQAPSRRIRRDGR